MENNTTCEMKMATPVLWLKSGIQRSAQIFFIPLKRIYVCHISLESHACRSTVPHIIAQRSSCGLTKIKTAHSSKAIYFALRFVFFFGGSFSSSSDFARFLDLVSFSFCLDLLPGLPLFLGLALPLGPGPFMHRARLSKVFKLTSVFVQQTKAATSSFFCSLSKKVASAPCVQTNKGFHAKLLAQWAPLLHRLPVGNSIACHSAQKTLRFSS